jgi:hypothetical protein
VGKPEETGPHGSPRCQCIEINVGLVEKGRDGVEWIYVAQVMGKLQVLLKTLINFHVPYRGADKSLARTGRKQTTATEDFDFHISYLQS